MNPLDTIRALTQSSFSGVKVYVSGMFPQRWELRQVRFPKTRRKRIRKKWWKNPRNWANVRSDVPHYFFNPNGDVYCNQAGWDALQEMIDERPSAPPDADWPGGIHPSAFAGGPAIS